MNDTTNRPNGYRLRPVETVDTPSVHATSQQRLVTLIDGDPAIQRVLATVSTPAGKLLKVISKSLGKAEAEIEFVEKITYRESE